MNKFKKKSLYLALVAGLGATGSAGAVYLGQDGTGQALIYPYYTVRTAGNDNYATYLNVTNTNNEYKAVKVRFLEGKNSREVLDFNLYLSPNDMWSGSITQTTAGAKLTSGDTSCVTGSGSFSASVTAGAVYPEFVNYSYTGDGSVGDAGVTAGADGEDTSLDRTREGYFEIIEMGVITDPLITTGLKHTSSGVPKDCTVVDDVDANYSPISGNSYVIAPTGGLAGSASLISVNNGTDEGFDPVVLENFHSSGEIWNPPGSIFPDMTNADPLSIVVWNNGGSFNIAASTWVSGSADAVSAVLMRDSVINRYVLEAGTLSKTDWVVTFPTKRHYVFADDGNDIYGTGSPDYVDPPFHNHFWTGGSCDPVTVQVYDREEQTTVANIKSSPPKPGQQDRLCWEANVITFKYNDAASLADASTMLGSKNRMEVNTPYQNGWANLAFADALDLTSTDGDTYTGLPVVGFMVQDYTNNSVTIGNQTYASLYGASFTHKYRRTITTPN